MRLPGKVAVITGAGAGLGRASALLFAENGASIVVVDIVGDRASSVAAEIEAAGGRAIARQADASVESEIAAAVDSAVTTFGKLDILYNNAGIGDWGYGSVPVERTELAHWQRVIDVNLSAAFLSTKHAIPHMRAAGGGSIVITSSVAAEIAMRYFPAYCASKAASRCMPRHWPSRLGSGTSGSTVSPPWTVWASTSGFPPKQRSRGRR